MSEVNEVLYLVPKRPDPKFNHKWRGAELLEMHVTQKDISIIEKFRAERLFVKISTKREITCSVMVEDVQKNEDGTFTVKFNDIRTDAWVLPAPLRRAVRGCVQGPPPIPVPLN